MNKKGESIKTSPARRHYLRETAARQAREENEVNLENLQPYQRLLYRLRQDKAALKLIESIQDKAKAKAEMLPAYAEWVQGVIESGSADPADEVFTTSVVWLIDTGALDAAKSGVKAVHILDGRVPHALLLEILGDQPMGTMIRSH